MIHVWILNCSYQHGILPLAWTRLGIYDQLDLCFCSFLVYLALVRNVVKSMTIAGWT
jgi:hypothetical protein